MTLRQAAHELNWNDTILDSKTGLGISGAKPLGYHTENGRKTDRQTGEQVCEQVILLVLE